MSEIVVGCGRAVLALVGVVLMLGVIQIVILQAKWILRHTSELVTEEQRRSPGRP